MRSSMRPPSGAQMREYCARPIGQPARVGDEGVGERRRRPRPLHVQLAHVREVEQARRLADRPVLLEDARVLHGHLPAAELDEARAGRRVPVVQRGAAHQAAAIVRGSMRSMAGRARATIWRSVSWRISALASSRGIQATSSNSWSCVAMSPPSGSIRK